MNALYYITRAGAILLVASLIGSCSVFEKTKSYVVRGSQSVEQTDSNGLVKPLNGKERDVTPPAKASKKGKKTTAASKNTANKATAGKAVKNAKNSLKDVSATDVENARRSSESIDAERHHESLPNGISSDSILKMYDMQRGDNSSLNGEWTIYSVRNKQITGEERPYLTFDLAARRFYCFNGCNILNGDVEVDTTDSRVKFSNVLSTMKMCDDAPFEFVINVALNDAAGYSWRHSGPNTFVDLKGTDGRVLMVLRRHNMDFLNGGWQVTTLNGTPIDGYKASITFNIPDLSIHGSTGCNIFNGQMFIDPDKDCSMQIFNLSTTRKACPGNIRETEFLLALENAETAMLTSGDTVSIFSRDGKLLFTLKRMELKQE